MQKNHREETRRQAVGAMLVTAVISIGVTLLACGIQWLTSG